MIRNLNELRREASLVRSEVAVASNRLNEMTDKSEEHKRSHLEYELSMREASHILRGKTDILNNLNIQIRTLKLAQQQVELDAKLEELKKSQPTFWEVLASCLDEVVNQTNTGVDLTFKPELKTSALLAQLKQMTDLKSHVSRESGEVLEAQKEFHKTMRELCLDQLEGKGFSNSKQTKLKQPIYKLLNNPTIRTTLSIA